jgi:hypothetical protein
VIIADSSLLKGDSLALLSTPRHLRHAIRWIETALQQPCQKLLEWVAKRWKMGREEIATEVTSLVALKPTGNLGPVEHSVNKARRFENEWKDRFWGIVWSHLHFVSEDHPKAIFFVTYWDTCMSYSGKTVIRGGDTGCEIYDGKQHAQGYDWVLPDIFAPIRAEYENGLAFGSLWDLWISEMQSELANLKSSYNGFNVAKQASAEV